MFVLGVWRSWTTPVAAGELGRRREAVLLTVAAGLVALSAAVELIELVSIAAGRHRDVAWALLDLAVGLGFFGMLRLARARRRLAGGLLLVAIGSLALLLLLDGGLTDPMVFALLALLVLLGGVLFGAGALLGTVAAGTAMLTAGWLLHRVGTVPLSSGDATRVTLGDVIGVVLVLGLMALVLREYTRQLPASAERSLDGDGGGATPGAGPGPAPLRTRTGALTIREVEVVQLLAEGLSNDGIARRLVVSPRTVQSHVANAMRKSGCANRTELGVLALREGLVPLAEPVDP